MAEDRSTTEPNSGIWRNLRTLLFGEQDDSLRAELEASIERHEGDPTPDQKGDLTPLERTMIRNLLHFGERDAGDVGVPRADIIAVEETTSFDELVRKFADAGHSRLPVYREKLDTIVGMIHIKDVFAILADPAQSRPDTLTPLIREPIFVPESRGLLDVLADMRASHRHLAVVLDEYSGTEGLITIEDLIEEIVGEIEDEHDEAPVALLVPLDGGAWDADARAELEDVAATVDPRLGETESDIDTLGGLAATIAGHVPQAGECIIHPSGWKLEVIEADSRRVNRLRLHPPRPVPEDEDA